MGAIDMIEVFLLRILHISHTPFPAMVPIFIFLIEIRMEGGSCKLLISESEYFNPMSVAWTREAVRVKEIRSFVSGIK